MLQPRIIPCLLMQNGALVKTVNFRTPKYVGDPINAVRIFNEREADELMLLDIGVSVQGKSPDFELIERIAAECSMPFCYGGGISNAFEAVQLVDSGVEKIAISNSAIRRPELVEEIADAVGGQSVVVVLDLKRTGDNKRPFSLLTHNAQEEVATDPFELMHELHERGVGEIVVNFIDNDGVMGGFDLQGAKQFFDVAKVPLTVIGGAGNHDHLRSLFETLGVVGAGAGSMFVFKGKFRAVLINYPTREVRGDICRSVNN